MNERYQKHKESYKKYREENKEKIKKLKKKWSVKNKERMSELRSKWRNKTYFGGLKDSILERDNYQCIKCGMSQEQHIVLFSRGLTVDHIDGKGRNSKEQNNSPENLQTLCLRCHGFKDGLLGIEIRKRGKK